MENFPAYKMYIEDKYKISHDIYKKVYTENDNDDFFYYHMKC